MPRERFIYEGRVGTTVEEGGFAASDIVLIDDRSDAVKQKPALLRAGGDEGEWWEGKSLYTIIDEFERSDVDAEDFVSAKRLRITIEVVE